MGASVNQHEPPVVSARENLQRFAASFASPMRTRKKKSPRTQFERSIFHSVLIVTCSERSTSFSKCSRTGLTRCKSKPACRDRVASLDWL